VYTPMEDAYASWKMRMLTWADLSSWAFGSSLVGSKSSLRLTTQSFFLIGKSSIVIGTGDSGYW
jgi:hypothetical protein